MTVIETIRSIQSKLLPVSGECALPEAERILGFLLGCSRSALYLSAQKELPHAIIQNIESIVGRRRTDEPLAYVLGSAYFYNREFMVTPDVLIPRPDTEILVEEVLKKETSAACRFLDMGTGSGCIAAILTESNPSWRAMATDLSFAALKVARANGNGRISFCRCDRLSAFKNSARGRFDFIVSNPPYIASPIIETLPGSVRRFEPVAALDGGDDGLAFYRSLAVDAPPLLKQGGRIYCEIGYDQGKTVPEIFSLQGWTGISVTKDLGGRDRVLRAIIPK
jgi:release factor glutamine methyltransferase